MRQISVSTDTYAAIWGDRRPGEDDEEAILRRKFDVKTRPTSSPPAANGQARSDKIGFTDGRFGIVLPEGFEIFRVYLGVEYRAKAFNGRWVLQSTGREYPTLNQLSHAIGAKTENAWQNWYYLRPDGKRALVNLLRK